MTLRKFLLGLIALIFSTTYAEAQKGLRKAKEKIPGAYLVAYVDGKAVSAQEARNKEQKK